MSGSISIPSVALGHFLACNRLWGILRPLSWRQHGWSYRRIADALAVNHETIRRWMPEEESGVARATPEHPTRVTGADGKSYAATKPKPPVIATSARQQERVLTAMDTFADDEHPFVTINR
jgi:hypothetical protein